jgi:peptide/nickel transport system substrate-binding protein
MSPIPRGSVSDPMTYKLHPLATGPYRIAHYVPDKALVLVRNVMWDPGTDPGRHQYVNRVVMDLQIPPEKIDATILADKGIGRTAVSESNVVAADYRAFSIRAPGRLIRSAMTCTYAWWPDNRKIDDVRIRRALAWAFPYRAAWRVSGEIPGVTRFPATNIQPPGTSGRVNYNPLPDHVPASTDPQRARALLQASAHLGYRLSWPYFSDLPESVALKAVLVSAFRAAGFDPKPYPMKYVDYTAQVMRNPAAPVNLRSMGWCGDWPTGLTWFPELFASNRIPNHGSGENLAFFSKPDVDRQIQQIIQLPLSRQPAAWNALDRLIQTRYFPMVVTGYGGVALMRGSLVHGAFADFVTGMPTFKDIWLGEAINDVTPWRTAD